MNQALRCLPGTYLSTRWSGRGISANDLPMTNESEAEPPGEVPVLLHKERPAAYCSISVAPPRPPGVPFPVASHQATIYRPATMQKWKLCIISGLFSGLEPSTILSTTIMVRAPYEVTIFPFRRASSREQAASGELQDAILRTSEYSRWQRDYLT